MLIADFAAPLPWLVAIFVVLWGLSLHLRDASIADIAWGPAFVFLAFAYANAHRLITPRAVIVLALVSAWGLRLGIHLALRSRGRGEDARYARMRNEAGPSWWWRSLFVVFLLQAVLAWIISAPLFAGVQRQAPELGPLGWLGIGLFGFGFVYEAVADWQLARFKADPANRGRTLSSGLWRTSRHPNYFGEFVLWWGFYVIALEVPGGWMTIPGPLLISFLLLRVSGVPMLEGMLRETKRGYGRYAKHTSRFFPWFPK